jgi:hypothetical protein
MEFLFRGDQVLQAIRNGTVGTIWNGHQIPELGNNAWLIWIGIPFCSVDGCGFRKASDVQDTIRAGNDVNIGEGIRNV